MARCRGRQTGVLRTTMIIDDPLGDRLLTALVDAAQNGNVKTKAAALAFVRWRDARCKLCGKPRYPYATCSRSLE